MDTEGSIDVRKESKTAAPPRLHAGVLPWKLAHNAAVCALVASVRRIVSGGFRAAAAGDDAAATLELYKAQCSALDKAAKVGIIHTNKANRKKSRLATLLKIAK